ncbi:glycosyl transferase [Leuconostoc litchii]|uniref:Glycosyltransferase family 4 protein n=1 Tax=Leuconostoc litchii TaxID=1981069 RepID=A0A6P2CK26_9LACO|nr:glycosyltransferase [Leuconostoc litchii]TYC46218.1 glycosyltransferase family 4 protein [Leuconostoc litchii]GMA69921.1 glycosyl transferase [Leuconostoc litchii]
MAKILIALESIDLGGMKRATTVVGNALTLNHDVTYYTFSDVPPFYELHAPLIVASPSVKLTSDAQPFERYAKEIKNFAKLARKYDVVILAGGLLSSFAAVLKPQLSDTKLIGWMHNNITTYAKQYYAQMNEAFVDGLGSLDSIVVLTDFDLAGFQQYNSHTIKIWNPLTIEPQGYSKLDKHVISFTSRIAIQHKGIDFAVQLASKLPNDWCLAMAGDGTKEDMEIFQQLIRNTQVEDKIIYRGPLKDEELRCHYRESSLFLQTSRWEGLPLVLVEAMSFGLPIVAMRQTGSAEVLDKGKYGILVDNGDVEAAVNEISALIRDPQQRLAWSKKSIQRVHDFQIEPILKQWEMLF